MKAFVWTEKMSVGHSIMDAQHRKILDLLNGFNDRFDPDLAFDTLFSMFRYARIHFHDEEALLERVGYPKLEEQKGEHQRFLAKASEFSEQKVEDPTLHIRLATFLFKWLKTHIEIEDMQYKPYVVELTPPPSS